MNILDISRYNECIGIKAQLMHVASAIDGFDSYDDDAISEDDYVTYLLPAEERIEKLAGIMSDRAKSYIEDVRT